MGYPADQNQALLESEQKRLGLKNETTIPIFPLDLSQGKNRQAKFFHHGLLLYRRPRRLYQCALADALCAKSGGDRYFPHHTRYGFVARAFCAIGSRARDHPFLSTGKRPAVCLFLL